MKITIISGSHRENSQSSKVARHYQQVMLDGICDEAPIIDLKGNPLPLWDEGLWSGDEKWASLLAPYRDTLNSSDGFVVITPEWHGQVPAGLKNFFLIFGRNELGNKPAKIVSVSSADGGAYPIAELRMSSYKNSRLCYIPEQMIIRNVEKVLNENAADNDTSADEYFRERIVWSLNILKQYAIALKQVRESGVTDTDKFGNGM
jgi:azobenzene reductase